MDYQKIFSKLKKNKEVFRALLSNIPKEEYIWKPLPGKWCMLEIICHLGDEEREDFRTRLKYVLEDPEKTPPPVDPEGWVKERDYMKQDFDRKLKEFCTERDNSVSWLQSLSDPKWENTYQHQTLGPMSAHKYLSNWLAHDYLHIRQITKLKYDYLKEISREDLNYAGNWEKPAKFSI